MDADIAKCSNCNSTVTLAADEVKICGRNIRSRGFAQRKLLSVNEEDDSETSEFKQDQEVDYVTLGPVWDYNDGLGTDADPERWSTASGDQFIDVEARFVPSNGMNEPTEQPDFPVRRPTSPTEGPNVNIATMNNINVGAGGGGSDEPTTAQRMDDGVASGVAEEVLNPATAKPVTAKPEVVKAATAKPVIGSIDVEARDDIAGEIPFADRGMGAIVPPNMERGMGAIVPAEFDVAPGIKSDMVTEFVADKIDGLRDISYKPMAPAHRPIPKDAIDVEARGAIAPTEGRNAVYSTTGTAVKLGNSDSVAGRVPSGVAENADEVPILEPVAKPAIKQVAIKPSLIEQAPAAITPAPAAITPAPAAITPAPAKPALAIGTAVVKPETFKPAAVKPSIMGLNAAAIKPAVDAIDVEARDAIAPTEGRNAVYSTTAVKVGNSDSVAGRVPSGVAENADEEPTVEPAVLEPANNEVEEVTEESVDEGQTVPEGMFVVIGGIAVVILVTILMPFGYFKFLRKASYPDQYKLLMDGLKLVDDTPQPCKSLRKEGSTSMDSLQGTVNSWTICMPNEQKSQQ